MYGEEYHFRSDPRRRDSAHLCDFVPLTRRNLSAKDVIGDKENAQDARNFLRAVQKGCLALNLHVWSGESC